MIPVFKYIAPLLLLAGLLVPGQALVAHPHSWIDLRSEVVTDSSGQVSGLKLYWLFDDIYSAFVLEDIRNQGDDPQMALRELAQTNLRELQSFGYFTDVRIDGSRVDLVPDGEAVTGILQDRLWLSFTLELPQPVDPVRQRLSYAVYDPTYYIEILHMEGEPVVIGQTGENSCYGLIQKATPPSEAIALAASLDRTQTAGDGLGKWFAETVTIECR